MPDWSGNRHIKDSINKKWRKGDFLRHAFCKDDCFPYSINLRCPTSTDISKCFSQVMEWEQSLRKDSKAVLGYGYEIIYKTVSPKGIGKNIIPDKVKLPTLQDVARLINVQAEIDLFLRNAHTLLERKSLQIYLPDSGDQNALMDWILKNPFKVIGMGKACDRFLSVLDWFVLHDRRDMYLRQLPIEGVDTKFIEANKTILAELLDIILPAGQLCFESNHFETRYGLKKKPHLVRFRILDEDYAINGLTDISIPLAEFVHLQLPVKRLFITENEVNFLCFPQTPNACIIFGKGYGIDLFKQVHWMKNKEILYWGDIDTHGFNILSAARNFLPQMQSFLMTEEILLKHRAFWVKEEKPFLSPIENLTTAEYTLACQLQANKWGTGVRLEQERVNFSYVQDFVHSLLGVC